MKRFTAILFAVMTTAVAGAPGKPPAGACSLIPATAIQKAFGEAVTNAKPTYQTSGHLKYSQCFYSLPTFSNSISVSMIAPARNSDHDAARERWNRSFHREGDNDADSEEREATANSVPLPNLGDEAFWVHSFVGNLYVLKGNKFLRISIGGKLTDEERQKRAKALAEAALYQTSTANTTKSEARTRTK